MTRILTALRRDADRRTAIAYAKGEAEARQRLASFLLELSEQATTTMPLPIVYLLAACAAQIISRGNK